MEPEEPEDLEQITAAFQIKPSIQVIIKEEDNLDIHNLFSFSNSKTSINTSSIDTNIVKENSLNGKNCNIIINITVQNF